MTVIAGTTRPEGAKVPAGARIARLVYEDTGSVEAALEVRHGFYENLWPLNALENLARSIVQLTKGHPWPQMPKVLHKD
jgi:hypothetical protein